MNEINSLFREMSELWKPKYIKASEKGNPEETGSSMPQICHRETTWSFCLIRNEDARPHRVKASPRWIFSTCFQNPTLYFLVSLRSAVNLHAAVF